MANIQGRQRRNDREGLDDRVLVHAPAEVDRAPAAAVLGEHQIPWEACASISALARAFEEGGAGALIVAEEPLAGSGFDELAGVVGRQPSWSQVPILVFAAGGEGEVLGLEALRALGSVTLLERPVGARFLASAVLASLRARAQQYELRRLLSELAEADRRKDESLAVLGHELRHPLGAILIAANLLEEELGEPNRRLEVLINQTRALGRMVDDLRDTSQIQRGQLELQPERVDVNEIVRDVAQVYAQRARERARRCQAAPAGEPLFVYADRVRTEQVIHNLLDNALAYTEEEGRIAIEAERGEGEALIHVRDDGAGLAPEELERLFEPFERAYLATGPGLGLGLSLASDLLRLQGGDISAESEGPGRGTTFTVRLPLASEED